MFLGGFGVGEGLVEFGKSMGLKDRIIESPQGVCRADIAGISRFLCAFVLRNDKLAGCLLADYGPTMTSFEEAGIRNGWGRLLLAAIVSGMFNAESSMY